MTVCINAMVVIGPDGEVFECPIFDVEFGCPVKDCDGRVVPAAPVYRYDHNGIPTDDRPAVYRLTRSVGAVYRPRERYTGPGGDQQ